VVFRLKSTWTLPATAPAYPNFVINTVVVSGVLSLPQGKRLAEMCSHGPVWPFPIT